MAYSTLPPTSNVGKTPPLTVENDVPLLVDNLVSLPSLTITTLS